MRTIDIDDATVCFALLRSIRQMEQPVSSTPGAKEIDAILQEALEFANIGVMRYKIDGTVVYMDICIAL